MHGFWLIGFMICSVVLAYHHLGYPALLVSCACLKRRLANPDVSVAETTPPTVTVLVPAHNEAMVITRKVGNLLETRYPPGKLAIILALDGCTDDTRELAVAAARSSEPASADPTASIHSPSVAACALSIVAYERNIGKIAILNREIARIQSEIVVLSDASAILQADGISRAVRHFADPSVGVVAVAYELVRAGSQGEKVYTDYLTAIRGNEAELDSPLGCHGACYLFRRDLWAPLPADTINDDFVLPLRIIARGYRGIYDMSVVARELETTTRPQEFRRRVRIGAGNMQQSVRLIGLLDPRRPWLAFMFVCGKGLRPFMPFVGALAILCALGMLGSFKYQALAVAGLAIAIFVVGRLAREGRSRLAAYLTYAMEGYAASLWGSIKFLIGRGVPAWQGAGTSASSIERTDVWPDFASSFAADSPCAPVRSHAPDEQCRGRAATAP
jgi:cellulose synthase/poly-beta-1,6-N-acetylglucosamine synthase-like glycosyltransferase